MLSNDDIDSIAHKIGLDPWYAGAIPRDYVKDIRINPEAVKLYIINLQTSQEEGSHWTAAIIGNGRCLFFDSYGLPPVASLEKLLVKHHIKDFWYQDEQFQQQSSRCGWFCLWWAKFTLIDKRPMSELNAKTCNEEVIKKFQSMLSPT